MLDPGRIPSKRKLKIALSELEAAFENASWEMAYYLDLQTGRITLVTDEMRRTLEAIYENASGEDEKEALSTALVEAVRDLPDWQGEALREADQVETGYGVRFIRVPQADSHEGYRDMEHFISTVGNKRLQDRLWRAISGRGAFHYFKDVLLDYPRERERWFKFKDARVRQRVLEWLESEGIEPIEE